MSKEVHTRSADQCRSHHQKILKYHYNIDEAIRYFVMRLFQDSPVEDYYDSWRPKNEAEGLTVRVNRNKVKIVLNVDLVASY